MSISPAIWSITGEDEARKIIDKEFSTKYSKFTGFDAHDTGVSRFSPEERINHNVKMLTIWMIEQAKTPQPDIKIMTSNDPVSAFLRCRNYFICKGKMNMVQKINREFTKDSKQIIMNRSKEIVSSVLEKPQKYCSWCSRGNIELLMCSKCKKRRYCGKDCQLNHWNADYLPHKNECVRPPQ